MAIVQEALQDHSLQSQGAPPQGGPPDCPLDLPPWLRRYRLWLENGRRRLEKRWPRLNERLPWLEKCLPWLNEHCPWVRWCWLRLEDHWLWLFPLLISLACFLAEWAWLDDIPTALTELQYAANQSTAHQVVEAWGWVGITPERIAFASLLDICGLVVFAGCLAWAAWAAEAHFRDGARKWEKWAVSGAAAAALCGLGGGLGLCAFFSLPLSDWWGTALLKIVFFCITLKTFLFSAIILYIASGFGQSKWSGGFWDATRACGFSLFAALVGPGLLAFGHQGTAIFGVISDGLTPADTVLYVKALGGILFFSLMCWGAARYAATYKEAEMQKAEMERGASAPARKGWLDGAVSFLHSLVVLPPEASALGAPEAYRMRAAAKAGGDDEGRKKWGAGWRAGEACVPHFCGLIPSVLIVLVILLADPTEIQNKSTAGGVAIVGLVVALTLWGHTHLRKTRPKLIAQADFYFYRGTILVGLTYVLWVCRAPQPPTLWLGPLAAWLVSFSFMVPLFTYLVTAGRRYGKPFLALALAYGFLINAADLNDDHGLRYKTIPVPARPAATGLPIPPRKHGEADPRDPKALNKAFDDWLLTVNAKRWPETHHGRPYPVLFVAAAGGGIVAGGVLTATMAELQRSHPEAEGHLFAISGVSGGSLGAVTYAALRDGGRNNAGEARQYCEAAEQVMTSDMLSPTVASLLGPEMVQRFLPFAVHDGRDGFENGFALDRGHALERAFEASLETHTLPRASVQAQTMLTDYPSPAEGLRRHRHFPALFLNTTCVETGQRMVISTLRPDPVPDDLKRLGAAQASHPTSGSAAGTDPADGTDGDWPLPFETLHDVNPRVDLPLTGAACLSARFPVVSPPAFLPQWREQPIRGADGGALFPLTVKRRYVDGGYYDNSGVETAMDVIDALQRQDLRREAEARREATAAGKPKAEGTAQAGGALWRPVLIAVHMDDTDTSLQYARRDLSGETLDGLETQDKQGTAPNPRRASGFDEILGPLNAFFNGWGGPARPQLMRARRRLRGPDGGSDFIELSFPHPVILSWYLSRSQYDAVRRQAIRQLCPSSVQDGLLDVWDPKPTVAADLIPGAGRQGLRLQAIFAGGPSPAPAAPRSPRQ